MCLCDVPCRLCCLPDPSSDVSVGFAVSPAAPSGSFVRCDGGICCSDGGSFRIRRPMCRWDLLCRQGFFRSFVRCVGGIRCVAGGTFRILRPMCRWDVLCRGGLFHDPSSDVSVGFAVSLAAPSGSFVRCVGWICCVAGRSFRILRPMCLCVAFLILRRMCRWDCCVVGGSFRILRPMCRWDLLWGRRFLPVPSPDVSVGFAVSPGLRLDPSSDVSVGFVVSQAAPSGSVVRNGWICCVAGGSFQILRPMCRLDLLCRQSFVWILRPMCRLDLLCRRRLLQDPSSDGSVGFAFAGGSFRILRLMCRSELLCRRRMLPDLSPDVPVGLAVSPAASSGSFVRCVGGICCSPAVPPGSIVRWVDGICCAAGGSSRISCPMCLWDLLCRRRLQDPSSVVSIGFDVSPAARSGSFVGCVGWICCVVGGSFRILRPMCRWDVLFCMGFLPDPLPEVSVGFAVSQAIHSGSSCDVSVGCAVSLAALCSWKGCCLCTDVACHWNASGEHHHAEIIKINIHSDNVRMQS
jgi:hypothetical protein